MKVLPLPTLPHKYIPFSFFCFAASDNELIFTELHDVRSEIRNETVPVSETTTTGTENTTTTTNVENSGETTEATTETTE